MSKSKDLVMFNRRQSVRRSKVEVCGSRQSVMLAESRIFTPEIGDSDSSLFELLQILNFRRFPSAPL
jgi:hypothetical protein